MVNKKASAAVITVLVVAAVATAGVVLFVFPYSPDSPPAADDTGWTEDGVQALADANNQFGTDLYYALEKTEQGKNMFYSPYSMFAALGMTYEGASGQTAEEMKDVFYFPESDVLRPNFAAVYNEINKGDKEYELKTGNALWVQQDYPFLEEYLTTVENYYGGKAANVDFVGETEKTRETINTFIEEQTNDKIEDLIPRGILTPSTRLVLTNAIYFKGTWEWEFDKSDTADRKFTTDVGKELQVPTMYMKPEEARFNYLDNGEVQVLELPYKGEEISMMIILPKQGREYDYETREEVEYDYTLEDVELSAEKLEEYRAAMEETSMDGIYLPKFKFETKYMMKNVLIDMGMPSAFGMSADFSGMNGAGGLYIQHVIHQAFVEVDEKGTEAAAATAVVVGEMSAGGPSNIFRADHPFVFVIQQRDTGNILFMGRVNNPLEN